VVLRHGANVKEIFGFEPHTTNNRMELKAAIEGLRALKQGCEVEIITDSEYVKNGITSWISNWKKRNWMTAAKKPVVNRDLWEELDEQSARHQTTWSWTKGHASHEDNNRADELASLAAREQKSSAA
jgi:ribonuclease HI